MKTLPMLLSTIIAPVCAFAQTYDTTFTGASGTDYRWDNPDNWSNGIPSESSNILIESEGLSTNNLAISGTIAVNTVEWNIVGSAAKQKGLSGGTLKANSITIDSTSYWSQLFCQGGSFDATNEAGTGIMTIKSSGSSLHFKAATIKADILHLASGGFLEIEKGGSVENPIISVNKYIQVDTSINVTSTSDDSYLRFGGIRGDGVITAKDGSNVASGYIELVNTDSSTFSGRLLLSNPDWGGSTNKSIHLTMNGSPTGVQYLTNSESSVSSVTVKNGEISMIAKNAGAISVEGGVLSVYDNGGTITDNVLNADSLSWSGGTIKLAIGMDFNSKIALSGELTKAEGAGGMNLQLSISEDVAYELSEMLKSEDSITRDLITYSSTNFDPADTSISVTGLEDFMYELNFGDTALSVTITQVPEPFAASLIAAVAVAGALALRRRR